MFTLEISLKEFASGIQNKSYILIVKCNSPCMDISVTLSEQCGDPDLFIRYKNNFSEYWSLAIGITVPIKLNELRKSVQCYKTFWREF